MVGDVGGLKGRRATFYTQAESIDICKADGAWECITIRRPFSVRHCICFIFSYCVACDNRDFLMRTCRTTRKLELTKPFFKRSLANLSIQSSLSKVVRRESCALGDIA